MNPFLFELVSTDRTTGRIQTQRFRSFDEAKRHAQRYIAANGDQNFCIEIRDLRKDYADQIVFTFG